MINGSRAPGRCTGPLLENWQFLWKFHWIQKWPGWLNFSPKAGAPALAWDWAWQADRWSPHRRRGTGGVTLREATEREGQAGATTTTRSTCGYYYYFCTTTWSIPRIVLLTSTTSTRSTKWYYVLLRLTAAFSPLYDSTWVLLLLMGSLIVHLCLHWWKGEWRMDEREKRRYLVLYQHQRRYLDLMLTFFIRCISQTIILFLFLKSHY